MNRDTFAEQVSRKTLVLKSCNMVLICIYIDIKYIPLKR